MELESNIDVNERVEDPEIDQVSPAVEKNDQSTNDNDREPSKNATCSDERCICTQENDSVATPSRDMTEKTFENGSGGELKEIPERSDNKAMDTGYEQRSGSCGGHITIEPPPAPALTERTQCEKSISESAMEQSQMPSNLTLPSGGQKHSRNAESVTSGDSIEGDIEGEQTVLDKDCRVEIAQLDDAIVSAQSGDERTEPLNSDSKTCDGGVSVGEPKDKKHPDCKHTYEELETMSLIFKRRFEQKRFVHLTYIRGMDPNIAMEFREPSNDEIREMSKDLTSSVLKRKFRKQVKAGFDPGSTLKLYLSNPDVQEMILFLRLQITDDKTRQKVLKRPEMYPHCEGLDSLQPMPSADQTVQKGSESEKSKQTVSMTDCTSLPEELPVKEWFRIFLDKGMSVDEAVGLVKSMLTQSDAVNRTNPDSSKLPDLNASESAKKAASNVEVPVAVCCGGELSKESNERRDVPATFTSLVDIANADVTNSCLKQLLAESARKKRQKKRKQLEKWFKRLNDEQMKVYNDLIEGGLQHEDALTKVLDQFYPFRSSNSQPPKSAASGLDGPKPHPQTLPLLPSQKATPEKSRGTCLPLKKDSGSQLGHLVPSNSCIQQKSRLSQKSDSTTDQCFLQSKNNATASLGQGDRVPPEQALTATRRSNERNTMVQPGPGTSRESQNKPQQSALRQYRPMSFRSPLGISSTVQTNRNTSSSLRGHAASSSNRKGAFTWFNKTGNQESLMSRYSTQQNITPTSPDVSVPGRTYFPQVRELRGSECIEERRTNREPARMQQRDGREIHPRVGSSGISVFHNDLLNARKREYVYDQIEETKRSRYEEPGYQTQLPWTPPQDSASTRFSNAHDLVYSEHSLASVEQRKACRPFKEAPRSRFDEYNDRRERLYPTTSGTQPEYPASGDTLHLWIVPNRYPQERLSKEESKMIEDNILEAILEVDDERAKPIFNGSSFKNGRYEVICENQLSKDWLYKYSSWCEPWPGASLKVIPAQDELKRTAMVSLPRCKNDDTNKIMKFLTKQNPDLNISEWEIVERLDGLAYTCLNVLVDEVSADRLLRVSRVHFKMGTANVVLRCPGQFANSSNLGTTPKASTSCMPDRFCDSRNPVSVSHSHGVDKQDSVNSFSLYRDPAEENRRLRRLGERGQPRGAQAAEPFSYEEMSDDEQDSICYGNRHPVFSSSRQAPLRSSINDAFHRPERYSTRELSQGSQSLYFY